MVRIIEKWGVSNYMPEEQETITITDKKRFNIATFSGGTIASIEEGYVVGKNGSLTMEWVEE